MVGVVGYMSADCSSVSVVVPAGVPDLFYPPLHLSVLEVVYLSRLAVSAESIKFDVLTKHPQPADIRRAVAMS